MPTINSKTDRSAQIFSDPASVYFPIYDDNEVLPANQDGKFNLYALQSSQRQATTVVNKTGSLIAANSLVRISGYSDPDGVPTITLADRSTGAKAEGFIGSAIANNATGLMLRRGLLTSANTTGATVGKRVYLGASGAYELTPSATGLHQDIGKVIKVDGAAGIVAVDLDYPVEGESLVQDFRQSTQYRANQLVYYQGQLFRATNDFTSSTAFDPADWDRADSNYGIANIVDYGADPNSTASTDNYAAIMAAIASGARGIFVPPGTFRIESAIEITSDGVEIFGVGSTSCIEQATELENVIEFKGASAASRLKNCSLKNIRLRGVRSWDAAVVKNIGSSVQNLGVYALWCDGFSMQQVEIDSCVGHGFNGHGSSRVQINSCYFHDQYFDPSQPAPNGGNADISSGTEPMLDSVIVGNIFTSNAKLHIFNSTVGRSMLINGNTFIPLDANGDLVAEANVNLSHNINYAYGNMDGEDGITNRFVISNNICALTRVGGIYGSTDSGTLDTNVGPEVVIHGNTLYRIGINTTTTDETINGAITVYPCRNAIISQNLVLDYVGIGKAIRIHSNITNGKGKFTAAITGNIVRGSSNAGIAVFGRIDHLTISGNIVRDATDEGMRLEMYQGTSGTPATLILTDNQVYDSGIEGIYLRLIEDNIRTVVARNQIFDSTGKGLRITEYVRNLQVIDNSIIDPGDYGIEVYSTSFATGRADIDVRGNYVRQPNNFDSIYIQYDPGPDILLVCNDNRCINTNVSAVADGIQINVNDMAGMCCRNIVEGNNQGIYFGGITGRVTDFLVSENILKDCGYGMRIVSSSNGLLPVSNNRFVNCSNRLYTATPGIVEAAVVGGDCIYGAMALASYTLPNGPSFGTWKVGDVLVATDAGISGTTMIRCSTAGAGGGTAQWAAV